MIFNLITRAKDLFFNSEKRGLGASNTQDAIDNLALMATTGAWDSSKIYLIGEYCVYNGKLYRCLRDNTGQTPADSAYWFDTTAGFELLTLNQSLATKVNTSSLGAAAYKGVATSVASGNTSLITSGAVYSKVGSFNSVTTILNASTYKMYKMNGRIEVDLNGCTYANFTSVVVPKIKSYLPKSAAIYFPVVAKTTGYYPAFAYVDSTGSVAIQYYTVGNGGSVPIDTAIIFGSFTYID